MKCIGFKCEYLTYNSPHNKNSHLESHKTSCWCNLKKDYVYVETNIFRDKKDISIKSHCCLPGIIDSIEKKKSKYIEILKELEGISSC